MSASHARALTATLLLLIEVYELCTCSFSGIFLEWDRQELKAISILISHSTRYRLKFAQSFILQSATGGSELLLTVRQCIKVKGY